MDEMLTHHGILGQKWGVRRFQNKDGSLTSAGRKHRESLDNKYKQAEKQAAQKRSESKKLDDARNRGTLTNDELREKIQRLKLEKELRELTDAEISPGKAFAKEVLRESGKRALTTMATGAMLYGGKSIISKEFDTSDFANAMFTGGSGGGGKKKNKGSENSNSDSDSSSDDKSSNTSKKSGAEKRKEKREQKEQKEHEKREERAQEKARKAYNKEYERTAKEQARAQAREDAVNRARYKSEFERVKREVDEEARREAEDRERLRRARTRGLPSGG